VNVGTVAFVPWVILVITVKLEESHVMRDLVDSVGNHVSIFLSYYNITLIFL